VASARRKNRRAASPVAVGRDEHVDDLSVLVDGAVDVAAKIAVVPPNT
jgi:hypothetical protein